MQTKMILRVVLIGVVGGALYLFQNGYVEFGNNVATYATLITLICVGILFAQKPYKLSTVQKQDIRDAQKKYPFTTIYPIKDSLEEINTDIHRYGSDFVYISHIMLFAVGSIVFGILGIVNTDLGILTLGFILLLPIGGFIALTLFFIVVQKCFNFLAFSARVKNKIAMTANLSPLETDTTNTILGNLNHYKKFVVVDLYIAVSIVLAVILALGFK